MMDKLRALLLFDFQAINFRLDDYLNVNRPRWSDSDFHERWNVHCSAIGNVYTYYFMMFCFYLLSILLSFEALFVRFSCINVGILSDQMNVWDFAATCVAKSSFKTHFSSDFMGKWLKLLALTPYNYLEIYSKNHCPNAIMLSIIAPARACEIAIHFLKWSVMEDFRFHS